MKKTVIWILRIVMPIVAISCTAVFTPWTLFTAWISPLPDTIQEQVDSAIDYGIDGIIVYVDQGGKQPEFYTAGWNNRENKIPANPKALFKIASISKLYIASATAKLAATGNISLDKTLDEYLPYLKGKIPNTDKITLRMLVRHRSGIYNYSDNPAYPWDKPYKNNKQPLELVYGQPSQFEPDTDYNYSNTNYLLIGAILDSTLGYSHHQYIKEEISTPLGLHNTYSLLADVNIDDVMSGYFVGYGPDIKYNDYIHPGGSMVATIQDVGIFLRALNDGTLLNKDEQAIYSSIYNYEHTGLIPGYQSIARYHKDIDAVVIQFVNTSGGDMWTLSEIIYDGVVDILREKTTSNKEGNSR